MTSGVEGLQRNSLETFWGNFSGRHGSQWSMGMWGLPGASSWI